MLVERQSGSQSPCPRVVADLAVVDDGDNDDGMSTQWPSPEFFLMPSIRKRNR
jgi:hypothetical protein